MAASWSLEIKVFSPFVLLVPEVLAEVYGSRAKYTVNDMCYS